MTLAANCWAGSTTKPGERKGKTRSQKYRVRERGGRELAARRPPRIRDYVWTPDFYKYVTCALSFSLFVTKLSGIFVKNTEYANSVMMIGIFRVGYTLTNDV